MVTFEELNQRQLEQTLERMIEACHRDGLWSGTRTAKSFYRGQEYGLRRALGAVKLAAAHEEMSAA